MCMWSLSMNFFNFFSCYTIGEYMSKLSGLDSLRLIEVWLNMYHIYSMDINLTQVHKDNNSLLMLTPPMAIEFLQLGEYITYSSLGLLHYMYAVTLRWPWGFELKVTFCNEGQNNTKRFKVENEIYSQVPVTWYRRTTSGEW